MLSVVAEVAGGTFMGGGGIFSYCRRRGKERNWVSLTERLAKARKGKKGGGGKGNPDTFIASG